MNRCTSPWSRPALLACLLTLQAGLALAKPPTAIATMPENADADVDPTTAFITITFDQDMKGSMSICGGGPAFPKITNRPTWNSPRQLRVPVKLEPDHVYTFSINCPSAQNFRSVNDEPAEFKPITFRTLPANQGPTRVSLPPGLNDQSFDELKQALYQDYAYYDRLSLDWDQLFRDARATPAPNTQRGPFVRSILQILAHAKDPHLTLQSDGMTFATFRATPTINVNPALLPSVVPEFRVQNEVVSTGHFPDGIGYIQINSWPSDQALLAPAHAALDDMLDAPGLIIDVRLNGGGDESTARTFAARLISEQAVYSKWRSRDITKPLGEGELNDRVITPAAESTRFKGRVAVLQGQACMSSNESFLLMLAQPPRITRFGATSFGSSGNPRPHELPNQVIVNIPSWQDYAPDGTRIEGKGVAPDMPVDFKPGADQVLDAALKFLREKP